ncbi:hypothetical protein FJZ53_02790 [Candidatus Woesearchaeota archaeon]|nr:hypothetical protein [Candidatus Woesearchaeota archaeon]
MRDASHEDPIRRWALFVKDHPGKWKRIHTEFINARFEKAEQIYHKLAQTKKGKEKIIKIFNIRNTKGYPSLL